MDGPETARPEPSGLTPPLRSASIHTGVYDSIFHGHSFERFAAEEEDANAREMLRHIAQETVESTERTNEALRRWSTLPSDMTAVVEKLHAELIRDLATLKDSAAEALLCVGMRAPTHALRLAFVDLADTARRHADALRELQGIHPTTQLPRSGAQTAVGTSMGTLERRPLDASLAQTLQRAVGELRADGHDVTRITLSAMALRRARDEGIVGPDDSTMFGLAVHVDFGWRGECFAIHTGDHATLEDILATTRPARATPRRD